MTTQSARARCPDCGQFARLTFSDGGGEAVFCSTCDDGYDHDPDFAPGGPADVLPLSAYD